MTVAVDTVVLKKLAPQTGVEIDVAIPVFAADEVVVTYGRAGTLLVPNTDYTVALEDPTAFDAFSITPTASLRSKLDDLIADDATEENAIWVRLVMDFLGDATPG